MRRAGATAGFGALEVLVSLTLFSVVAAALLRTTIGATQGNHASKSAAVATTLIYDKVEQFRSYDSGVAPADLAAGYHLDPLGPLTATGQAGGTFLRSWMVADDVPRHGISRVEITVSWSDPVARAISATTYVCRTATCS